MVVEPPFPVHSGLRGFCKGSKEQVRMIIKDVIMDHYLFLALHRVHRLRYALHWMYMKTTPPVNPTVTTTNLVQNGQLINPRFTSSVARSISTHSDHITQVAAAQWNNTEQKRRRRSIPDICKARHWKKGRI